MNGLPGDLVDAIKVLREDLLAHGVGVCHGARRIDVYFKTTCVRRFLDQALSHSAPVPGCALECTLGILLFARCHPNQQSENHAGPAPIAPVCRLRLEVHRLRTCAAFPSSPLNGRAHGVLHALSRRAHRVLSEHTDYGASEAPYVIQRWCYELAQLAGSTELTKQPRFDYGTDACDCVRASMMLALHETDRFIACAAGGESGPGPEPALELWRDALAKYNTVLGSTHHDCNVR